jgi:two-component system response regulator PhoP
MRLLIVEDELDIRTQVARHFEAAGYRVEAVADGLEGLYFATEYAFDALVLDLGLPGLNGLDIIRKLRAQGSRLPILALTARGRWQDRVQGLELGADDYLAKPFQMEELAARVLALLRRSQAGAQAVLDLGPITLDLDAQSVKLNGAEVELTAMEYRMFEFLARRRGRVVSRGELREFLYPDEDDPDSNVIEVMIRRLRRKLDPDGALQLIETLRGRGYRLGS